MKQRLVMAASFIHDPKVLVVDEPMVGLDPKGARLIKAIFRARCQKGATILMSTHTLEVAQGHVRPHRHHSQWQADRTRIHG